MTTMTMTKMSSSSSMFLLMLTLSYPMINLASAEPISTVLPSEEPTSEEGVLEDAVLEHMVIYSGLPPAPDYQSWGGFDPRGMEHVYLIVHTFLDLILRDNVLPRGLNTSQVISAVQGGEEPSLKLAADHWQDLLLQYIGVLTIALFGIFLALLLPVIGFFFCCCRCAGRCGAYPDTHYDKKSDRCKRVSLGIFLSFFVIAVVFGTVSAFVTNQYTYSGWVNMREKVDSSLEDAGGYFQHTGESINVLLVNNFAEMEEVIGEVLDDSGPILKRKLADITEAIAIDDLTAIVSGLGKVKKNLNSILNDTRQLDDKVSQLRDGLARSQTDLSKALEECTSNAACASFLADYDLDEDLAMAEDFINIEFKMPEVTDILTDISSLIDNDIEEKVKNGKNKLDSLEGEIEDSIEDIKPKVKSEIREMGVQLQRQNSDIQQALRQINDDVASVQQEVPEQHLKTLPFVMMRYYLGLGMASTVLLILVLFILGLFYGMCGRRPGGLYGDDCCNRGTGASFLVTAVYFTFLFSCALLILTTAHFVVGAAVEKVVCQSLTTPDQSDVFKQIDRQFLQPKITEALSGPSRGATQYTAAGLLADCHTNATLFNILKLEEVYNLSKLTDWRTAYGIGDYIENLKNKIQMEQLTHITLLSPETAKHLQDLAQSKISDMNFTKFTAVLEKEITKIDLTSFIRRLKELKDTVYQFDSTRSIAPKLENEALWLGTMNSLVAEMKQTVGKLKVTAGELEQNIKFNKSSMREAISSLIGQANRATDMIQTRGPQLIQSITDRYVSETVGLIDEYVERVIDSLRYEVGFCAPLSTSYNATVTAICQEVVDPFNGFWASIGWCCLLYLPAILLSVSLISLYRKVEPYPGPLMEAQPLHNAGGGGGGDGGGADKAKGRRKGHTRNPSGYLPEYTHARPPPQQMVNGGRFRDIAPANWDREATSSQPPRYTSTPSLPGGNPGPAGEYERPPPYYYPGPAPAPGPK